MVGGFLIFLPSMLASVGLRVSGSQDRAEVACEIACHSMMLFPDMLLLDYAICALERQGTRQSAKAINAYIPHQMMALQSLSSLQSHSSLSPPSHALDSLHSHSRSVPPRCREFLALGVRPARPTEALSRLLAPALVCPIIISTPPWTPMRRLI